MAKTALYDIRFNLPGERGMLAFLFPYQGPNQSNFVGAGNGSNDERF